MSPPPASAPSSNDTQADDDFPNLPNVPSDLPDVPTTSSSTKPDDDIDFDDLSRRFEELKKKK